MSGSALFELQKGVYSKLSADTNLVETLLGGTVGGDTRIYDAPAENQTHPYVVIGDATEAAADTMAKSVKRLDIFVRVWSRYPGAKQADDVLARVAALLDGASMTLTGYTLIRMVHSESSVIREGDGVTRQGALRCTAWATQD
jgi:hypothetical protein